MAWVHQGRAPVDDERSKGLRCDSECVSQSEVADASSEGCDEDVDVHDRGSTSELRRAGLGLSARGVARRRDDRSAVASSVRWVRSAGVASGNGRGLVGDAAGGGAGERDGVDAVDS